MTYSPSPALVAFGLSLRFETPPPGAWEARPLTEPSLPSLQIQTVTAQAIEQSWSGLEAIGWEGMIDGAPFVVERGVKGDHRVGRRQPTAAPRRLRGLGGGPPRYRAGGTRLRVRSSVTRARLWSHL